jgi:hypothetical protein
MEGIVLVLVIVLTIVYFIIVNSIFNITYFSCQGVTSLLIGCGIAAWFTAACLAWFFIQYWVWLLVAVVIWVVWVIVKSNGETGE